MGLSKVSIIKVLKAFLPLMNFLKLTQDESCLNQKAFLPFFLLRIQYSSLHFLRVRKQMPVMPYSFLVP